MDVWLPPNTTWKDLTPGPDKAVTYTDFRHVLYPIPMALVFIALRFVIEKYLIAPFGISLGIKPGRNKKAPTNPKLEAAYRASPNSKKTLRPATTPTLATPTRGTSPAPRPPRSSRRRLVPGNRIANLEANSGSDSDLVSTGDEDEERADDWVDPAIRMRSIARRLRELEVESEEEEPASSGEQQRIIMGDEMGLGAEVEVEADPGLDEDMEVEDEVVLEAEVEAPTSPCTSPLRADAGFVPASEELVEAEVEAPTSFPRTSPLQADPGLVPVFNEMVEAEVEAPTSSPRDSFSWSADFTQFTGQEEEYSLTPGPKTDQQEPLGIFLAIWDVAILGVIVDQVNKYAWQTIAALSERGSIPKYLDLWKETSIDEMRRFFAMLMLMTMDYRARIDEYWTTGILGMPGFREMMSRNRFQLLMRFLHFNDNFEIPANLTPYEKKVAKISSLYNSIQRKFSCLYTPTRELSLDETLLLWKGRLSWKQCIRSKAARFGIKSFELCESATGYLLRSILYAGKDSTFVEGPIHGFTNKTCKVVLELMDGFLDLGHLVVMDNWYNQLPLTRFLKNRKTDVLGTLNKNRMFVPNDIKAANPKRMNRGDQIARHCGDITVIAWKDVKLVTVLSTFHNAERVRGRRAGQSLWKPAAVESYNKYMGGVDLKDIKLSHYPMEGKRGRKWYIEVFMRLLNTSITNAYIIHSKQNPTESQLEHRQFRFALACSLLESSHVCKSPGR